MESNSVCNRASDLQIGTTVKRESDLLILSMITDRIGRHEVPLTINHNHYNIPQKYKFHLKNSFYWSFLNIIRNICTIVCKMAVKFLLKHSEETNPLQFYKVSLLNWLL